MFINYNDTNHIAISITLIIIIMQLTLDRCRSKSLLVLIHFINTLWWDYCCSRFTTETQGGQVDGIRERAH